LDIPAYKAHNQLTTVIKALITLCIGLGFYFLTSTFQTDQHQIERTFKVLNLSGMILILWCVVQAIDWYSDHDYSLWLINTNYLYSVSRVTNGRISGFALEPSWLAHMLNMIYLPWWFAATIKGFSVHKKRVLFFSFENLLFLGGIIFLFLTLSRAGLFSFLLMIAYITSRWGIRFIRTLRDLLLNRWSFVNKIPYSKTMLTSTMIILILAIIVSAAIGIGVFLSKTDPRMADLFNFNFSQPNAILKYAEELAFGPRVVYWGAGWEIFNRHPIFGVGLGNAGFFFPDTLPDYAWHLVEVQELLFKSSDLLNIKNLWIRLLAETGIIGFSLFITWLFVLWRGLRSIENHKVKIFPVIALMGQFCIVGLLSEGFSIDSFALPYIWFGLGLVTAGVSLAYKDYQKEAPQLMEEINE
jgi:O-antigen ligase